MKALGRVLLCVAIWMCGLPQSSKAAQSNPYPDNVNFVGGTAAPRLTRPGQSVWVIVHGASQFLAPTIELRIPSGLAVSSDPQCEASVSLNPVGDTNQNATSDYVYCGVSVARPAGMIVIKGTVTPTSRAVLFYNVELSVAVQVPMSAPAGMVYAITSPEGGLTGQEESIQIEVLNPDGSRATSPPTPTMVNDDRPPTPTNTSQIMVFPQMVEASPGQTVALDVSLARSATLDLDRIAIYVWAESGTITNFPPEQIDDDGQSACTEGEEGDETPAPGRADEVSRDNPLPKSILVRIDDDVPPGRELLVCVEMIGFDRQGMTLYSWNAPGIIRVV